MYHDQNLGKVASGVGTWCKHCTVCYLNLQLFSYGFVFCVALLMLLLLFYLLCLFVVVFVCLLLPFFVCVFVCVFGGYSSMSTYAAIPAVNK